MRDARENRMNVLANNGIDTSKYFTVFIDKAMFDSGSIMLKKSGDGITATLLDFAKKTNAPNAEIEELRDKIRNNGTIACTRLFRRWICAKMLRIQYDIAKGLYPNIETLMRTFKIDYMTEVIANEVNMMDAIHRDGDMETFFEITKFFNVGLLTEIYWQWFTDLRTAKENAKIHIQNRHSWTQEQKEYIHIGTRDVYVTDIEKDLAKIEDLIENLEGNAYPITAMKEIAALNKYFTKHEYLIKYSVPKAFMEAYKANGAYYTLKNLVLFHKAELINNDTGEVLSGTEAFEYLKNYLDHFDPRSNGYKIYALMKNTLRHNDINITNLF